jgi:hypothetical protein
VPEYMQLSLKVCITSAQNTLVTKYFPRKGKFFIDKGVKSECHSSGNSVSKRMQNFLYYYLTLRYSMRTVNNNSPRLILLCLTSCSVLFCSVLFCSVLFCSVLFCSVLFCSVLFCSVLCVLIKRCLLRNVVYL